MHLATTLGIGLLSTGATVTAALLSDPNQVVLSPFPSLAGNCASDGPISCQNTTAVHDLCCFEAPGGMLLQTQFWDKKGPHESWTIHGLWPNNCKAGYAEFCDKRREQDDIIGILEDNGAGELVTYMKEYWPDLSDDYNKFWRHEWNKHGTCLSTIRPECLPNHANKGADVTAYFTTAVALFQEFNTYDWLKNAGITPSYDETYTFKELEDALREGSGGFIPTIRCKRDHKKSHLKEVHWYLNVQGPLMNGTYYTVDSHVKTNCPSEGIVYPPKPGSKPEPPKVPRPGPTNPPTDLPPRALIRTLLPSPGRSGHRQHGGLISAGVWSTQQLATFTLSGDKKALTLSSKKGDCGIEGGRLTCGNNVRPTTFSTVTSEGNLLLAYGDSTEFSSDGLAKGKNAYPVYPGGTHEHGYTLAIVSV